MNKAELKRHYARMRQDAAARLCSKCGSVKSGTNFRLYSRVCNDCRARKQREDAEARRKHRDYRRLESSKARRKELDALRKAAERRLDEDRKVKTCRSCKSKKPWSYYEPHAFGVYGLGSICSNCRKEVACESRSV